MRLPDGWITGGIIVWNELDPRGHAAKGFVVETPDLGNASHAFLNQFHDAVRQVLRSLDESTRLQLRWSVDSDYQDELLAYDRVTEQTECNWAREVRQERFTRYWNQMKARQLRREVLHLYLSRPIHGKAGGSQEAGEELVRQLAKALNHSGQVVRDILGSVGCTVTPMEDQQHFNAFSQFFNPSFAQRTEFDAGELYRPEESIQANCFRSECRAFTPDASSGVGFQSDGHFHQVLVLTRPPQRTYPGIIRRLLDQTFLDYRITVNVIAKSSRQEVEREEKQLERLRGDFASEARHSLLTAIEKKETKISNLSHGTVHPFEFELIVHVWDATADGLASKCAALKEAIHAMAGADYLEPSLAPTTRNLWAASWPGWMWSPCKHHRLYGEDSWLADLLPFSSTFTGHLKDAEAIYEGNNRNLIGVRTRISDTPQLAVMLGMTRAGKSAFVNDLLSQTQPHYPFTLILEEGLSYGHLSEKLGSHPIRIRPDGELTLNYFDTQGAPLSALQIESASALVLQMAGACADEETRKLRLAQIAEYVEGLYTDVYESWAQDHPAGVLEVARVALAVRRIQAECLPPGATFLEGWNLLRQWQSDPSHTEAIAELLTSFSEDELSQFLTQPETAELVRNTAFASFAPEQFPTHEMLYETLHNLPLAHHDRRQIQDLASLLRPWCARKLVNGVSNFSFQQGHVHFDLTEIPESASDLRAVVAFLIANQARQHIITLPRSVAKRVVFEEVGRTLDMPGGERLVSEFYAQMSKFNVWIVSIVQQYGRFKQSPIRPTIMGNAKQFYLLRQNDRADLDDICRDIELPEVTREAIMSYPLPEHLPEAEGGKYSSLTYYHLGANRPVCGTVRNRASEEMLEVSSSSPTAFDRRSRHQLQPPTPLVHAS